MSTSEQILNTATTMLQTRGFNAFSYNDIANELGIKTASIHYHYPGKHNLGLSVMTNYRRLHREALENIDTEIQNPLKKLYAFAELFNCTLGEDFRICPCGMLTTDMYALPEPIKDEVQGFFSDSEQWLSKVLKDGLRQNLFHFDASPNDCAKTLFAAFEGAMLSARAFEDKSRLSKSLKLIIKLIQH